MKKKAKSLSLFQHIDKSKKTTQAKKRTGKSRKKTSPRLKSCPKNSFLWFFATLAAVVLLAHNILFFSPEKIEYDLNEHNTGTWKAINNSEVQQLPNSLQLRAPQGQYAGLFGPFDASISTLYWRQFPYLEIVYKPFSEDRIIYLAWLRDSMISRDFMSQEKLSAHTRRFLFDVRTPVNRSLASWKSWLRSSEPIGQNILVLLPSSTELEIEKIVLHKKVNAIDWLALLFRQLFQAELVGARSINGYMGLRVFGQSVSVIFGLLLFMTVLCVAVFRRRRIAMVLIFVLVGSFLIQDIVMNKRLVDHWRNSIASSAWVYDKYAEYESRFDKEFSLLSRLLEERVPRGSKVLFLYPAAFKQSEISFPSVLYTGYYDISHDKKWGGRTYSIDPSAIKNYDYVFYYKPRQYIHDSKRGMLIERTSQTGEGVAVQTIVELSPFAKVLKVIHD